jgi:hypothetical protein
MSAQDYDAAFTSAISQLPLAMQKKLQARWHKAKAKR